MFTVADIHDERLRSGLAAADDTVRGAHTDVRDGIDISDVAQARRQALADRFAPPAPNGSPMPAVDHGPDPFAWTDDDRAQFAAYGITLGDVDNDDPVLRGDDRYRGLHPAHRAKLIDSAVAPAQAATRRRYQSLTDMSRLGRFSGRVRGRHTGLGMRLYDADGKVNGFIVRPDNPRPDQNGKIRKYEVPVGAANVLDVAPGTVDLIEAGHTRVFLTEGPIKADALVSAGLPAVSITGVWNWRHKLVDADGKPIWQVERDGKGEDAPIKTIEGRQETGPIPDLADFATRFPDVTLIVAFDSDAAVNPTVYLAAERMAAYLRTGTEHNGADEPKDGVPPMPRVMAVEYLVLPTLPGMDKTGVDDYLAAIGPDGIDDLIYDEQPKLRVFLGGKDGTSLRARTLITEVRARGPFRNGRDGLYVYRDGYWQRDGRAVVHRLVQTLLGEGFRPAHASTVIGALEADPMTIVAGADPTLINLRNGLLDWDHPDGPRLLPHTPDCLSTVRIPVDWNPRATDPRIDRFLRQVLPADAVDYAYELVGYPLQADNPGHVAVMLYGTGLNGKGTLLRMLTVFYGPDNVADESPQRLDTNTFAAYNLVGKVAVLAGDVDATTFKSTETFKRATGQDNLRGEAKLKMPFSFRFDGLYWASFNRQPGSADTSDGWYRRWTILPFATKFDGAATIPNLDRELTTDAELSGLLVRAVHGLRAYRRRGRFDTPPSVVAAGEEFKIDTDMIREFAASEHVDIGGATAGLTVRRILEGWCEANGYRYPPTGRAFNVRFAAALAERFPGASFRGNTTCRPPGWPDGKTVKGWPGVTVRPIAE